MDHPKTVFDLLVITWGYFSKEYARTERVQHLGIDLRASAGTTIGSTTAGRVFEIGGVGQNKYLVVQDRSGFHVYGHIEPKVRRFEEVSFRQELGVVLHPKGGPHLHYGINRSGKWNIDDIWGWGRGPLNASKEDASRKGWVDPRMALFSMNLVSGGTSFHLVLN